MKQGICTNLPSACSKAASHERVDIPPTMRCPECGKPLLPAPGGGAARGGGRGLVVALAAMVLAGAAAGGWFLYGRGSGSGTPAGGESAAAPARTASSAAAALRIDGIAPATVQLGAALAEGFLRADGAPSVARQVGDMPLQLTMIGETGTAIDLRARGAVEALKQLRSGSADLVVLDRPLSVAEREELRLLGDLASPANEIVVGLDAVAVIVAPSNPLSQLGVATLREIYAGRLKNWSQVPGSTLNGPIKAFASAPATAAWETFRGAAMGDAAIADDVSRIDNPDALLRSVAGEPNAIGFVPLQHAHTAKVLAVADGVALAFVPNRLSVATEDYALTRRLYLYVPPHARPLARRFAEFAASDAGQVLVEQAGFTGQVPAQHGPEALRLASFPPAYLQGVQGARRLSVNLRFRPGAAELDGKAQRDVERLARLLRTVPAAVLLVGLSDDGGKGAEAAAKALAAAGVRGAKTRPLAVAVTVADASRRDYNRRVEVWLTEVPVAPAPPIVAERPPAPRVAAPAPATVVAQPKPAAPAARPAPAPAEARPAPAPIAPPPAAPVGGGGPTLLLKPGK